MALLLKWTALVRRCVFRHGRRAEARVTPTTLTGDCRRPSALPEPRLLLSPQQERQPAPGATDGEQVTSLIRSFPFDPPALFPGEGRPTDTARPGNNVSRHNAPDGRSPTSCLMLGSPWVRLASEGDASAAVDLLRGKFQAAVEREPSDHSATRHLQSAGLESAGLAVVHVGVCGFYRAARRVWQSGHAMGKDCAPA